MIVTPLQGDLTDLEAKLKASKGVLEGLAGTIYMADMCVYVCGKESRARASSERKSDDFFIFLVTGAEAIVYSAYYRSASEYHKVSFCSQASGKLFITAL